MDNRLINFYLNLLYDHDINLEIGMSEVVFGGGQGVDFSFFHEGHSNHALALKVAKFNGCPHPDEVMTGKIEKGLSEDEAAIEYIFGHLLANYWWKGMVDVAAEKNAKLHASMMTDFEDIPFDQEFEIEHVPLEYSEGRKRYRLNEKNGGFISSRAPL